MPDHKNAIICAEMPQICSETRPSVGRVLSKLWPSFEAKQPQQSLKKWTEVKVLVSVCVTVFPCDKWVKMEGE